MKDLKLPIRLGRRLSVASSTTAEPSDRQEEEDGNEIKAIAIPHPMVRKRKRSLTIPLTEPVKVGLIRKKLQETYDQLQCPLFSVLPPEIRLYIWELVLGGFHIHIFDWSRRLGHLICSPDEQTPQRVRHVCMGPLDYGNTGGVLHRTPYSFLSLPLTCRRVYSESIEFIYSANKFHFLNYRYRMSRLSCRILPSRWNSIRRIYLTYFLPQISYYEDDFFLGRWASQCTLLSQMPNLQVLVIGLACPRYQIAYEMEPDVLIKRAYKPFLQLLKEIRVKGMFDVYIPYTEDVDLNTAFFQGEHIPFRIRQMSAHVLRFHERQSNDIPIDQAVRAFGY